ncbi:hypothetical protein TNCV_1436341 [Trichonephila clavipes]|nr:hypothetical protein TNCV_1436341 [Trichonephila clavipes]
MAKGEVTPVIIHSYEHHTCDSTIWPASTPTLRENTVAVVRASHLSSPFTNLTRGLAARRLFSVPPCLAGTTHLQTSMPSPRIEPRPYGTAVSVANHYTGRETSSLYFMAVRESLLKVSRVNHHITQRLS